MRSMKILKRRKEEGATMVEYAIMVAVFAIGLIAAVVVMRGAVESGFEEVKTQIDKYVNN